MSSHKHHVGPILKAIEAVVYLTVLKKATLWFSRAQSTWLCAIGSKFCDEETTKSGVSDYLFLNLTVSGVEI